MGRMKTFGLTGGIGMGKSTAADLLRRRGIPVVDSDVIAREIVEPGQPALTEIQKRFGADIIDADGRLRREELARRIFSDTCARRDLESILHPCIRAIWQARLKEWQSEGHAVGVAIIPLLFETDAAGSFDTTVCVACTAASQRERLRARGWTDGQIDQRIQAQLPIGKKMSLADRVVWTEGSLGVHEEQLRRILP